MGIRYYAYAFDNHQTAAALADPRSYVSSDPFADAWGLEPHARVGVATMKQRSAERDLLYLDKAWPSLQRMTHADSSGVARPAFRMFEGDITQDAAGWHSWIRALAPDELPVIAEDLAALAAEANSNGMAEFQGHEREYVLQYLDGAVRFVQGLVSEQRGMVYVIG